MRPEVPPRDPKATIRRLVELIETPTEARRERRAGPHLVKRLLDDGEYYWLLSQGQWQLAGRIRSQNRSIYLQFVRDARRKAKRLQRQRLKLGSAKLSEILRDEAAIEYHSLMMRGAAVLHWARFRSASHVAMAAYLRIVGITSPVTTIS